jgi:hypothetical protein
MASHVVMRIQADNVKFILPGNGRIGNTGLTGVFEKRAQPGLIPAGDGAVFYRQKGSRSFSQRDRRCGLAVFGIGRPAAGGVGLAGRPYFTGVQTGPFSLYSTPSLSFNWAF